MMNHAGDTKTYNTGTGGRLVNEVASSELLPQAKDYKFGIGKIDSGINFSALHFKEIMPQMSSERDDFNRKGPVVPPESGSHSQSLTSPLGSPSENISRALELPAHKLYSEAIISQMLSLRIEQEKTKQVQDKIELGRIVAQLFKEFEAHQLSSQLIHRLFLDEDCEQLRNQVGHLRQQISKSADSTQKDVCISQPSNKSAQPLPQEQSLCTPSPNRSPATTPETLQSSLSMTNSNSSGTSRASHHDQLHNIHHLPPIISMKNRIHSQEHLHTKYFDKKQDGNTREVTETRTPIITRPQTSPGMQVLAQPIYPVYYQVSEPFASQQTQGGNTAPSQSGASSEAGSPPSSHGQTVTSRKNSPLMANAVLQNDYSSHNCAKLGSTSHPKIDEQHHQRYVQPVYYVNAPPPAPASNAPNLPPHFFTPLPPSAEIDSQLAPMKTNPSVPQTKRPILEEENHTNKKPRGSKGGISFMISTPKNPPARKYNKPSASS